ncbi:MAG: HD domain-containing protein [Saprospiraceae bacterium]
MNEKLQKAIDITTKAFINKKRLNGNDYVSHCINVMEILKEFGFENEEDILIAGIMHDVCEDTPIPNKQIFDLFGERVGFIINALSKNKKPKNNQLHGNHRFMMYMNRFYMGMLAEPYILFIKLADQIDNLQSVEVFRTEKIKRKIDEIEIYFMPQYEKIIKNHELPQKYIERFDKMKNRLLNIIVEKKYCLI